MKRKGQLTIANISGMAILLFIFAVAWTPITQGLSTAFTGANPLVKATIILIPLGIIIAFLTMPFTLAEKERERRARQNPNQPRAMQRRNQR